MARAERARTLNAVPEMAADATNDPSDQVDRPIQARRRDAAAELTRSTGSIIDESRIVAVRQRRVASIGRRIRELRRNRFTLSQLAELSEVSVGLLSRLENGVGNPSFVSLNAIARALDVDVYTFFESPDSSPSVLRTVDRARIRMVKTKVELEPLVPSLAAGHEAGLVAALVHLPRNHADEQWVQNSTHGHDQFEVLLTGTVHYQVDHEFYELHEGDAILFDPARRHKRHNVSRTDPATVLLIARQLNFL